jgi:hypothetical protein
VTCVTVWSIADFPAHFPFARFRSAGVVAEHSARFGIEAGREIMQRMGTVPEILANKDKNCRILQKRFASHLA